MARPAVRCIPVRATLLSRGEEGLSASMLEHVDGCFRCRSELSGHRALRSELAALSPTAHTAPPDTVHRVMAEVGPWAVPDPAPRTTSTIKIAAAAAVATAATAAAAGTAIVFRVYRHRAA